MTDEEKLESLQAKKEELTAKNQQLDAELAKLRSQLMEYDVNVNEYTPDIRTFLKNLDAEEMKRIKVELLYAYEIEGKKSFDDETFLEDFVKRVLDPEEMTKTFSYTESVTFESFLSLLDGKQVVDFEVVLSLRPLLEKGLVCLCGEGGKNVPFLTDDVKEVVKKLDIATIRQANIENEEIFQYVLSGVNLYGAVHYKALSDIYTHYNPEKKVTAERFKEVAENYIQKVKETSFIVDGYVSLEFFYDCEEDLAKLIMLQEEKPRYIPTSKEEFLKYRGGDYIRPTLESKAMMAFFEEIDDDPVHLENLMGMIQFEQENSSSVQDTMHSIIYYNYLPPTKKEQSKMLDLLVAMDFNARKWEHNGYSAFDLHTKFPNQFSLNKQTKPQKFTQTEGQSKNGPCPCGSGKKYKRCCGK